MMEYLIQQGCGEEGCIYQQKDLQSSDHDILAVMGDPALVLQGLVQGNNVAARWLTMDPQTGCYRINTLANHSHKLSVAQLVKSRSTTCQAGCNCRPAATSFRLRNTCRCCPVRQPLRPKRDPRAKPLSLSDMLHRGKASCSRGSACRSSESSG